MGDIPVGLLASGVVISTVFWQRAERESAASRAEARRAELAAEFLGSMLQSIDFERVDASDPVLRRLLDGAVERLKSGELSDAPMAELRVLGEIAHAYRLIGAHQEADETFQRALDLARATYGPVHRRVADELHGLGHALADGGRHDAALEAHQAALVILDQLGLHDDPSYAEYLSDVADHLGSLGRSAEALSKAEEGLALAERLHDGDKSVARTLGSLANCLEDLGRAAEALPNRERALAIALRLKPRDHPEVATAYASLAYCLRELGRFDEALVSYQKALAMRERIVTGDHPSLVTTTGNVARCLLALSRHDEALRLFEQALAMAERLYPDEHPKIAQLLYFITEARHQAGGDLNVAEVDAERAVWMYRRHAHWSTEEYIHALNVLEGIYEEQGRLVEAAALMEELIGLGATGRIPSNGKTVAAALSRLGPLLRRMGRHEEAEARLREGLGLARTAWGNAHDNVGVFLVYLGEVVLERGRLEEAEELARDAVAIYRPFGAERVGMYRVAIEEVLAKALRAKGEIDVLKSVYGEFLAYCRANLPGEHPERTRALGTYCLLLLERGHYTEAEPFIRELLSIREEILKPDSPDFWLLAQNRSMLGETLVGQAAALVEEATNASTHELTRAILGADQVPTDRLTAASAKLREAESLILDAYTWFSANFDRVNPALPLQLRQDRVRQAGQRIVELYQTWHAAEPGQGYATKAAEWRQKLENHMQPHTTTGPSP